MCIGICLYITHTYVHTVYVSLHICIYKDWTEGWGGGKRQGEGSGGWGEGGVGV
jgi:hypothetical protein